MKPQVQQQGKCVIQRDGKEFLVMFPNGDIQQAKTPAVAERICKRWFRDNNEPDKIGIGIIDWRL